jgi:NO-binding membrane sensor protein with MHYT domain
MESMSSSYNLFLVSLSFIISVLGSFTALQLAIRIPVADKKAIGFWVLSAGIALGGGAIWSMHFIAMLAMNMPFTIQFDLGLTFLSAVVAIVFVSLGLVIAGRDLLGETSLVLGGLIAGLGVSSMHYMGMSAMRMPATISYDYTWVIVSVGIGVVASIVALWLAFNLRGPMQRFGSAIIMGVAVCGMHYTGMYAATMTMTKTAIPEVSVSGLSTLGLAGAVSIVTAILLLSILYLSHLKTNRKRSISAH